MSTTSTTPPAGSVLASDAEREAVVQRVHHAVGEGRLDLTEAERRTTAAYAAQHREELEPLVADLPPLPVGAGTAGSPPTWASIREALVWRAHLLVWGPRSGRPSAAQCRTATIVATAAVAWFVLCALLGALVVGA